jgi:hypothetical protein
VREAFAQKDETGKAPHSRKSYNGKKKRKRKKYNKGW